MKLHNGFITYNSGAEQIMVAAGSASDIFRGMVRSNETAAFIIECLKEDISFDALCQMYRIMKLRNYHSLYDRKPYLRPCLD